MASRPYCSPKLLPLRSGTFGTYRLSLSALKGNIITSVVLGTSNMRCCHLLIWSLVFGIVLGRLLHERDFNDFDDDSHDSIGLLDEDFDNVDPWDTMVCS